MNLRSCSSTITLQMPKRIFPFGLRLFCPPEVTNIDGDEKNDKLSMYVVFWN